MDMRPTTLAPIYFVVLIAASSCETFFNPDFREAEPLEVEHVYPEMYDTDFPVDGAIRIKFNKHLDANYLSSRHLELHSGEVAKWLMTYYDPVTRELVVWTSSHLFGNTVWDFSIVGELHALDGTIISAMPVTRFKTSERKLESPIFEQRDFFSDVQPIFDSHCVTCHGQQKFTDLDLRDKNGLAKTTINITSEQWPRLELIVPFRPGASYLVYKLLDGENIAGQPMPRALELDSQVIPLSETEQRIIVDWIAGGAVF